MAIHRSLVTLLPFFSLLAAANAFTPHNLTTLWTNVVEPLAPITPVINLTTPWTDAVDPLAPWPQHPRPSLYRPDWQSLNGPWNYTLTGASRSEEGVITVPYCIESLLSGVHHGIEVGSNIGK